MPKRIEPPEDKIGVQNVPEKPLSKQQLAAILDHLQIDVPRELAKAKDQAVLFSAPNPARTWPLLPFTNKYSIYRA